MNKIKYMLLMGIVIALLVGCSSEKNKYSPDQVIKNALETTTSLESYYAEIDIITKDKDEVLEEVYMKEWQSTDGKRRIETDNKDETDLTIAVNDGQIFTTYLVESNEALVFNSEEMMNQQQSFKEQVFFYLESIHETHNIKVKGEEKVAGRQAHHIVAEPKESGGLLGEQEIWVDKENWLVLKMNVMMGDTKVEMNYTNIDLDPEISDDLFKLDLPEDVDVIDEDDIASSEEVFLDDVAQNIGHPVLYFPEENGLTITMVEKTDLTGELGRTEVQIDYDLDGKPLISLFMFETPEDIDDIDFMDEESIEIRGTNGSYIDIDVMRFLSWQEDGISYSIDIIDEGVMIDDIVKMADDMKLLD